jgi:tetratricopeptide (TPR) repeat protein
VFLGDAWTSYHLFEAVQKIMNNVVKLLEQGEEHEAKTLLVERVKLNQDDISSWRLLAKLYLKNSDFTHGIEAFENIIRLNPTSPIASSGLVRCCIECEQYQHALNEIERYQLIAPAESEEAQFVVAEHEATRARLDSM